MCWVASNTDLRCLALALPCECRCLLDVLCADTTRDPFPALPSPVCHCAVFPQFCLPLYTMFMYLLFP